MREYRPQKFPEDNVLISVITTVLNGVQYVEQTIQSVISQTYRNLEYIIIDGGSTDGTVDIIRKYESKLAYWHSKPDRGIAHSFNLGLAKARGDWVLFLHADDLFLGSEMVEMMVPHLLAHKDADVVFGETIKMARQQEPKPLPLVKIYGHPWRWQEFRWFDTIPHPSAFTNRHYFDWVGEFDETFRVCMDYDHYLRAGKNLRARYIPLTVSGMRDGGTSTISAVRTFGEIMRALNNNKALPRVLLWLNFIGGIGRFYLGRGVHKILDPFASKIAWPGRNSGKLL